MPKKITLSKAQTADMVALYAKGLPCSKIAERLGYSKSFIENTLHKEGVTFRTTSEIKRIYTLDQTFFRTIDTEAKAYVLGFLYGDGSVTALNCNICIGGLQSDRQIFKDIAAAMDSNRPFTTTKRGYLVSCVASVKMRTDLARLGVVPNKTKILTFPSRHVPDHLRHHFIRGLFDADGSITMCKDKRCANRFIANWNIYSTRELLETVKNIMADAGIPLNELCRDKRCYANSAILATSKATTLHLVRDYLYAEATIFLKRKRDRFDEVLLAKPKEGIVLSRLKAA